MFALAVALAIAPAFARENAGETQARPLPDFKVSTSCDWQAEVRRTNTWLERDQRARMALWQLMQAHPAGIPRADYEPVQKQLDEESAALQGELEDLVMRCGWPSTTAFGQRAGENAYLIVQHASSAFQARYLPLIQAAAEAGELPKRFWASLFDRLQLAKGLPQRFGSQLCEAGQGQWKACEVESVDGIDARRAEVGMVPASWCSYLAMNEVEHPACATPPPAAAGAGSAERQEGSPSAAGRPKRQGQGKPPQAQRR